MDNHIHIQNIKIEDANAHLTAEENIVPEVHLFRFNFEMEDIRVSNKTLKNKIPFTYGKYRIAYDRLYYKFSPIYKLINFTPESR